MAARPNPGMCFCLVPSVDSQAGTAYYSTPISLNGATTFSTSFEFLVTNDPSSSLGVTDGFTFLMQNSSGGVNALGVGGEGMGYQGLCPALLWTSADATRRSSAS